jgi:hypothetical protein
LVIELRKGDALRQFELLAVSGLHQQHTQEKEYKTRVKMFHDEQFYKDHN